MHISFNLTLYGVKNLYHRAFCRGVLVSSGGSKHYIWLGWWPKSKLLMSLLGEKEKFVPCYSSLSLLPHVCRPEDTLGLETKKSDYWCSLPCFDKIRKILFRAFMMSGMSFQKKRIWIYDAKLNILMYYWLSMTS